MRAATLAFPAALLLVLLQAPAAAAGPQDPTTYPDGILEVAHTPVLDSQDFDVAVQLSDDLGAAAERVTVTVCRFKTMEAAGPDICYMNLGAAQADGAWGASTDAAQHPDWRDGWVLGYKVTVKTASGETHAPDRLAANGEPDYYRFVVGDSEQPAAGSAVVEDSPVAPVAGGDLAGGQEPGRESPASPLLALLALGLALGGLAARRR